MRSPGKRVSQPLFVFFLAYVFLCVNGMAEIFTQLTDAVYENTYLQCLNIGRIW